MTVPSEPVRLTSNHRDTLAQIFRHPVSHNLEWHRVLSLLGEVGLVTERHDGKFAVTLGETTEVLERPHGKDIEVQQVLDVRRMLTAAGFHGDDTGEP